MDNRRRMMLASGKKDLTITATRSDKTSGKYLEFARATADGVDISSAGTYKFPKGTVINCTIGAGKNSYVGYIKYNGVAKASVGGLSDETHYVSWSFVLESNVKIDFSVKHKADLYKNNSYGNITITTT